MKWTFVVIGALVALVPLASFVLVGLEVVMVYQIAKSRNAVYIGDLVWFCSIMTVVSLFLKFLAAWLHLIPVIGQIANSLVAGGFIYFVFDVADSHYSSLAAKGAR
jgi:hypothetical protein